MRISERGLGRIKAVERFREFAYPDPLSPLARATRGARWGFKPAREIMAALLPEKRSLKATPWTCGYGQTHNVTPDTRMSLDEAEQDLCNNIRSYEEMVLAACTLAPTQNQFDALVCLAWNCPVAVSPKTSSIIKAHNRGDTVAAARAFDLYCMSGGVKSEALLARRRSEAADYLALDDAEPSPQVVDAPKPMTASKINLAQTAAGATAGIAAVNEAINSISAFKSGLDSLGNWVLPLMLVGVVALCAFTVYQRFQLRAQGAA